MSPSSAAAPFWGGVAICDEIRAIAPIARLDEVVAHMRFGGADCWGCKAPIRTEDDASMILEIASTGERVGFAHYVCLPSQIVELRKDRRASLEFADRFDDMAATVQCFTALRNSVEPRAMVVVSPESPLQFFNDAGETIRPFFELWLSKGMELLAPDVYDATPTYRPIFRVTIANSGDLAVTYGFHDLYRGSASLPPGWLRAAKLEKRCLVVCAGIGIDSTHLEGDAFSAMNATAHQGLLVGIVAEFR